MATIYDEFDTIYAPPGKAIDDGGAQFPTIQGAVDNADNWVLVGPGTFNEAVTVTKDQFDLIGTGVATHIDAEGQGGSAITFTGDEGSVRWLRVDTGADANTALNVNGPADEEKIRVVGILVENTDSNGISVDQNNSVVSNCIVKAADNYGVLIAGSGCAVGGLTVGNEANAGVRIRTTNNVLSNVVVRQSRDAGANGVELAATDIAASNIHVLNAPNNGIVLESDDIGLSNFTIVGSGGDGLVVQGTDDVISNGIVKTSTGADLNDGAATTPHYSNVLAGGTQQDNIAASSVTDATWVQRLVDSPNGTIMNAVLDNGDSAEITVPVPDTETLKVYFWGAWQISDGTTPANLDVELKDGGDTVQATENTGGTESTDPANPVASHQNTTGSTSIYKLAVANDTGGTITDPGVGGAFAYIVE